jgi:regulator of nucleoside diphosphate kinase
MKKRTIYITREDADRLSEWIRVSASRHAVEREHIRTLEEELARAKIVSAEKVPPDVVTVHSEVRLMDMKTKQEMQFTLVFPDDARRRHDCLSVLAPLGAAILGCRAGEEVKYVAPAGPCAVRIEEILYQPEAAGAS